MNTALQALNYLFKPYGQGEESIFKALTQYLSSEEPCKTTEINNVTTWMKYTPAA